MRKPWRSSAAAVALLCLALAACGKSTSSGGGTQTAAALPPGCGTVPQKGVNDPDGVIAKLGAAYTTAYNGYAATVHASPWATWKPKGSGPYTIGISVSQLSNPWQATLFNTVKDGIAKLPNVGKVIPLVSTFQVSNQLQQFRSLIAQKVDLIVYEPLAPDAFVPAVTEATKAGIPSLSIVNTTPAADTINLAPNAYFHGASMAAELAKAIGGKGTVLGVHAIPGVATDRDTFAGFKAALAQCPQITLDDSVTGQFSDAVAKTEVLKYLSAHPGKIAGVVQSGVMASGIISAFQQAGRPVPPVADAGAEKGALAWWRDHESTYKGVGAGMGPAAFGDAAVRVTGRLLAGDGVKVSDIVANQTIITSANLSQWVDASWTLSTPGSAEGPAGVYAPDSYLDPLFTTTG